VYSRKLGLSVLSLLQWSVWCLPILL